ncbi:MAG: hypothetical protein K2M91_09815 [Lachnospiraceae bacterium]|nr:hypothetical protein [Lachnospiraceae bacterium]
MAEKIDLKALAESFGMKVSGLAAFMGYTKQALYQLNDGTSGICTSRYYAALKLLQSQNEKLYEADMQKKRRRGNRKGLFSRCVRTLVL